MPSLYPIVSKVFILYNLLSSTLSVNMKDCKSLGKNRWEYIGKCPNNKKISAHSYVDVQNKYIDNALGKIIPGKGITSEIIKDITRFNPIDIGTNVIGMLSSTPCINTTFNDDDKSKSSHNYLQYATDNFPDKRKL